MICVGARTQATHTPNKKLIKRWSHVDVIHLFPPIRCVAWLCYENVVTTCIAGILLTLTSFPFGIDGVTPKTGVAEDKSLSGEEFWLDEYLGFEIRVAWSYKLKAFARCREVTVKTSESMRRVVRALSFNFTPTFALQLRKITKPQWMYLEVARHSSFCRLDCLDWLADF